MTTSEPLTLAQAQAMPRPRRPGPGVCDGYAGEDKRHDRHVLIRLPLRADPYFGNGSRMREAMRRWRAITDGRTCSICWAVYDPAPMCEAVTDWARYADDRRADVLCTARAMLTEPGRIGDPFHATRAGYHDGATEEHRYCGRHAPSRLRAREAKVEAARAVRKARDDERWDRHAAREDVVEAAIEWWADEQAVGEGICAERCEHHVCRLARVVQRHLDLQARR